MHPPNAPLVPARLLLASLALAACPAEGPLLPTTGTTTDPDATTTTGDTPTSTSTSSSSGGPVAPTDTGDVPETTTAATSTGPTADTSTDDGGISTTTDDATSTTDATDTTGAPACAPTWVVPDVPADALAAHDLAWVGCEFTACGPDEAPGLACGEFTLAGVPLEYLGVMHPNATGAFTTDDVVGPNSFNWLDGERHTWRWADSVYILTEEDAPADQLDVYFAVRALELLAARPELDPLLVEPAEFPAGVPLAGLNWKNRLRGVILSFDTSPLYIAAGLTILDADPGKMGNLDLYSNVAAISIDRETIRGAVQDLGSAEIYGDPDPDANFLRYLREGLPETLVHELLHTRVDRLNSVDEGMNTLYFHRGEVNACAPFELEEALVAATSLLYWREDGGLSDTYLDYYDAILEQNLAIVAACPESATWEQLYSLPSGVDPRYDLRMLDL